MVLSLKTFVTPGKNFLIQRPLTFSRAVFNRSTLAAGLLMAAGALPVEAGVKLAAVFGDHMVLQRDRNISVWGEGDPQATVEVTIASQHVTVSVGTNGTWQASLKPMPAGGPYRLTAAAGDTTVTIQDVLYGDVWLCSGQSNMQMPVKETLPAEQAMAVAKHARIRLGTVAKGWNATQQTSADIKWQVGTPAAAGNFSAVGYYFASELLQDPTLAKVPIGVIDSSVGGTMCEAWIPQTALAGCDPAILHDSMFGIKPAMLYNAMIAPLGHSPIKGVIWYQGEGNASHPETYPWLLSTLIAQWRLQFDSPDLPFAIVQLPDFSSPGDSYHWPWQREAQAQVARAIPHTSLVVGIETTDGNNLHPKQKREIGRRAALLVRRDVYQEKIVGSGPTFKAARVDETNIWVTFDTAGSPLASRLTNQEVRGFAVAGEDGIYHFASARIDGDRVSVHCAEVPAPKTVRYAWASVPNATLINEAGLPAAPFRTDDFAYDNIEVQPEPVSHVVRTSNYEIRVDGNGRVTSLAVRGAQFLANEPGLAGGTSIPVMFGSKSLADIQNLGPGLLSCSDGSVTFRLQFKPAGMVWSITNQDKDEIKFNIALSTSVRVDRPAESKLVTLSHNNSTVAIAGIDTVSYSDSGAVLQVGIKGKSSRELVFEMNEK